MCVCVVTVYIVCMCCVSVVKQCMHPKAKGGYFLAYYFVRVWIA